MHRNYLPILLFALLLLQACTGSLWSAPLLSITMSPSAISFTGQDPDFFTTVQSNQTVTVQTTSSGIPGKNYFLTIQARGDLVAAGAIIPISAVTWQVVKIDGDNQVIFTTGTQTLTSTPPGVVIWKGKGNDNKPGAAGIMTFFVQNLWTQAAGTYTQTADLTLSAP